MKRPALQSKRVGVLRMAFQARDVFGSFEKRTPVNDTRKTPTAAGTSSENATSHLCNRAISIALSH